MGSSASFPQIAVDEVVKPKIVVFGATGMIGGGVASVLLSGKKFRINAITRQPFLPQARELAEIGAIINVADLYDPHSLETVMSGAYGVFLYTSFWEDLDVEKEVLQGKNAIDAALKCKVKHLVIFGGSESDAEESGCGYFMAKAQIENYLLTTDVPYTILRMPFFYENIMSIFKPHHLGDNKFAIIYPLEDNSIDTMSLYDMGRCVESIFVHSEKYVGQTVHLATERLTSAQIAVDLNKVASTVQFLHPKITLTDYAAFGFDGAHELAAVFRYYRHLDPSLCEVKTTRKLCGHLVTFNKWAKMNRDKIMSSLEYLDEPCDE